MNSRSETQAACSERTRCVVIFNPVAGPGDADADRERILDLLGGRYKVDLRETTEDISATELALQAIGEGIEVIIAAGGDGTLREVAEAAAGHSVKTGIIPRGTANAFAAAIFGAGPALDPIGVGCRAIHEGATTRIDTALCNGKRMLLLAGIGIERGMIERADRELKSKFGALAYLVGGWQQLRDQEPFEVLIDGDSGKFLFNTRSLVVANAAPPSSIFAQGNGAPVYDDGLLDITAIVNTETSLDLGRTLVSLISSALSDSPDDNDHVVHFRSARLRIHAAPPQKIVVDGEITGTTPVDISIEAKSLEFFSPAAGVGD